MGTLAPEAQRGQVAGARGFRQARSSPAASPWWRTWSIPTCRRCTMNLRYLATSRAWFGGGSDLTPAFPFAQDTSDFHCSAARSVARATAPTPMREFKAWCDRCFYPPHRQEARGVGGIFFDDLASARVRQADFAFVRAVGEALPGRLSRGSSHGARRTPYDEAARERLLLNAAAMSRFNLVYDRGTRFGFQTDADPETYLMSLPPVVKW